MDWCTAGVIAGGLPSLLRVRELRWFPQYRFGDSGDLVNPMEARHANSSGGTSHSTNLAAAVPELLSWEV